MNTNTPYNIENTDKSNKEKGLFALSIILHILAILCLLSGILFPLFKPIFNMALEGFGKAIVFILFMDIWIILGILSLGFLFMADKFRSIPATFFKELFETDTEFVVEFNYKLIIILATISIVLLIISIILISRIKDTFVLRIYKIKRNRRIWSIVYSIIATLFAIFQLIKVV